MILIVVMKMKAMTLMHQVTQNNEGYPITDELVDEQNIIKDYYFKSFCNIVPESSLEYIFLTEKINKPLNQTTIFSFGTWLFK